MYPRRNVRFGYGGLREKKNSHRREIKRVAVRERELKGEFEREKAMRERERERESWQREMQSPFS